MRPIKSKPKTPVARPPKPPDTASGHTTDDVLRHMLNTPPVKKPKPEPKGK
jgi:hypothetical protein